jgi:hypothetical protein
MATIIGKQILSLIAWKVKGWLFVFWVPKFFNLKSVIENEGTNSAKILI